MNIYELVTARNLMEYWLETNVNSNPSLGETLFPYQREVGIKLEWIKGTNNQPVQLRLSAYDAKSIRRDRKGVDKAETEMPFFKESVYIDENMRQHLNTLVQTNNQTLINSILRKIFSSEVDLLKSAFVTLERMRMELLGAGTITLASNGQSYSYDFGMPVANITTVTTSWSTATADIIGDIETIKTNAKAKGVLITRAICNITVAKQIAQNTNIKNSMYVFANGNVNLTTERALQFISQETGITFLVHDDVYVDEAGTATKYVADNKVIFLPDGALGYTHLGVTPEESDLMNSLNADVQISPEGIAMTTTKETDPVNVETKISMVALPSFERANEVFVLNTVVTSA